MPGVSVISRSIHRYVRSVKVTKMSLCRFAVISKMGEPGFLIGEVIEPYRVGVWTERTEITLRCCGVISFLWRLFSFLLAFRLSDE